MKRKILFTGAVLFMLPLLSWSFDFVKNGKALTGITLKSSEKGVILASQELTEYTKKVTSTDISKSKNGKIIIGTVKSKDIPSSIIRKLKNNPSDEAFFLGTVDGKYYIVGQNGVAAYYGAVETIERSLGVRWYYPGEKGERYTAKKNVILPDKGKVYTPVFSRRVVNTVSCAGLCREGHIWAARNKIQSPGQGSYNSLVRHRDFFESRLLLDRVLAGGHETFTIPLSPKKYGKTHPEYFALVDGKRRVEGKMLHYCLSNPEVEQKVYEFVISQFEKFGENFTFNFGCVDAYANCCECANCKKMDGGSSLDISRRFHIFAQNVSKRVWKKYPKAKLSQWAYWNYRNYPKGLVLDPRTTIYYCATQRCYSHALDDPSCMRNVKGLKLLKEWLTVCKNVYIYEYSLAVGGCAYQPYSEITHKDLLLYKKLGVIGRKEEMVYPDASYYFGRTRKLGVWRNKNLMASRWQFWYIFGRACWDPDFDYNKKIAEIEKGFYGKLYPAMKKYQDLRRKLWKETPGCIGFPFGDQRTPMILQKPGAKEELQKYLAEAEKLAGKDPALKRIVDFEKGALLNYWIIPNEKYKKSLSRTASAPMVKKGPVIDGNTKDAVWGKACYITDFKDTFGKKEPMPAPIATSIGILSDKENLYFLLQAKEPFVKELRLKAGNANKMEIFGDDSFEILIAPPNNAQKYYQVAVTPKGTVLELENPGANPQIALGTAAKGKIHKDGYVIEVKIPVRKMEGVFGDGAVWKFHVARNYRTNKNSKLKHFTLDGTPHHSTTDYRSITIGSPVIKNGSFEDGIDPKTKRPKFWGFQGKNAAANISLVKESGNTAIKLTKGAILSQILYGKYFRPKAPIKVELTLKAKGKGSLWVTDGRFDQIINKRGKAANRFLPKKTKVIGKFPLTSTDKIFTLQYTITPLEFSQLRFRAIGKESYVILDDISAKTAD